MSRNFYGVVRVREAGDPQALERKLVHGSILHGQQYMSGETRRRPTTYYVESSGIGRLLRALHDRPVDVGVVGLGTGTIAAYGKPGDRYHFFEIDPAVVAVAQHYFTFLADSSADGAAARGRWPAAVAARRGAAARRAGGRCVLRRFDSGAPAHARGGRALPAAHQAGRRGRAAREQPLPRPAPGGRPHRRRHAAARGLRGRRDPGERRTREGVVRLDPARARSCTARRGDDPRGRARPAAMRGRRRPGPTTTATSRR